MTTFSWYITSLRKDLVDENGDPRTYGTAEKPHYRNGANEQEILDWIAAKADQYKYGIPAQIIPFANVFVGQTGPTTPANETEAENLLRSLHPEWFFVHYQTDTEVKPLIDMQAEEITLAAQYEIVVADATVKMADQATSNQRVADAKTFIKNNWTKIRNHALTNAEAQQVIHALCELSRDVFGDELE